MELTRSCPWKGAAACAAIYFAATPISVWITSAALPVALATGVALAVLALLGVDYWPVVLAAGWLSAIALGHPPSVAAPLAIIGLVEALAGVAMLRGRGNKIAAAGLVLVVVPVIGATLMAGVNGVAWKTWWIKDAIGLLLLAPLWTLRPRTAEQTRPVPQSASESILNLCTALVSFETAAPVMVTNSQETPAHQPK